MLKSPVTFSPFLNVLFQVGSLKCIFVLCIMIDWNGLDKRAHRSQWDLCLAPESLQDRQNEVGEAQTLQHSRDPEPGPGHWNKQHKHRYYLIYHILYVYNSLTCRQDISDDLRNQGSFYWFVLQGSDGQREVKQSCEIQMWKCQECGKLIKDSQLSLGLDGLRWIGLAAAWEIDGNLHIS